MRALPLKRFVDPRRPITYGIVQAGDDVPEGVPYIRPVDMEAHAGVPDVSALRRTSHEIASQYARSQVVPGDIVISIGPSFGKTMVVPKELAGANLTQGTARIAPKRNVDTRYLVWALQASTTTSHWASAVGGATFRALNLEPLSATPVPAWPGTTQRAIAAFLDAETARIDALIAKKRRLVELVKQRVLQLAHISSDVGARVPLRRFVESVQTGATPPASEFDSLVGSDVPWFSPGDVAEMLELRRPARSLEARAVHQGWCPSFPADSTLVVGIGATAGRVAHLNEQAIGNQQMTCIASGQGLRPRFLSWQLLARQDELRAVAPYATLPIISNEFLRALLVSAPSEAVQDAVVRRLDSLAGKVQTATEALDRQLALLQERRQALITAAVTGQLDIPGLAA